MNDIEIAAKAGILLKMAEYSVDEKMFPFIYKMSMILNDGLDNIIQMEKNNV